MRSLASERPWPFYPLLVGAYFVFFLYSVNLDEAELGDVLPVLTVVLLAILVLLLGFGLLVGSVRRVALVLTAAVTAFLAYGHVAGLLAPYRFPFGLQQIAWAAAVVLAGVVAWRIRDWLVPVTRGLIAGRRARARHAPRDRPAPGRADDRGSGALATAEGASPPPALASDEPIASGDLPDGKLPDIVYLIWDRYPGRSRPSSASISTTPCTTSSGIVASTSWTAAVRTTSARACRLLDVSAETLNGRGHSDEVFGKTDMSGNYTGIQNSNVARFLKSLGYYYVHIGSDFSGKRPGVLADENRHSTVCRTSRTPSSSRRPSRQSSAAWA